ncbi:Sec23-binding domain of Sec16-domain-containing protein [Cristinia sonorae]|uniref:Protein transport protein sec16 n=1 Tax=Cristinia sonorae TaxID=1940300 RepID=A0A8K0UXH9_9AGAR|nr:Sec23-binding domain of Sec16-domain-containing protein [Cristinia sonorae]
MSSSSTLSLSSAPPKDPYAPSSHSRQPSVDSYKYSSPPQSFHVPSESAFAAPTTPGVQTLSVPTRLTQAPYAPSPSLLGSNDPLGRTSVRIPVVSFGFGGKLVTCFHGASNIGVGFDVAINSRDVHIRTLHKIIPQSALDNSSASYPGPLFLDPGTPVTSLVRTATTTQAKTKKTRVVKYLDERAEEISQGLGYLHRESLEGRRAEATLTLLLLLKVMVENDGKLSGSAQIDAAVRKALVPHVASQEPAAADSMGSPPLVPHGFTSIPSAPFGSVGSVHNDSPISVNTLRSAHLDKIQEYLIRGERRLAFQYAADEKLWAHAMVIASSIDRDAWKEVVREFIQAELTINSSAAGRESLRVAYSLYAGHGAASVEQLAPQKLLINNVAGLQAPPLHGSTVTPLSPNFPLTAPSVPIAQEVLSKWMETATMIITNPMTTEASSALTALGDQLLSNHWIEAAHVCYLLSPQTSPMGGANNVAARVVLVGGANPATSPSFWKNLDPVIFTEIAEFALSLGTTAKGQEAFGGLPHLQAYRLIRATYLAEIGHVQVAHRYCEAISSSLGRSSPYVHSTLLAELKSLTDRLIAAPQLDKSGSWIGSKMTRPSLDKLGNWLEGRLTSFIAGEGDTPTSDTPHKLDHSFSGPFAHYSQITSATPSNIPTPQRSMTDLTEVSNHAPTPPYRSGSAMALRPPASVPINRASSAMDYVRRKASPVPRVSSASAATASFADAYSPDTNGYSHFSESTPKPYQGPSNRRLETSTETDERSSVAPHTGSWWNDTTESTVPTPTVANFVKAEGVALESTDGFVSLMDDNAFSVTPTPSSMKGSYSNQSHVDEVDEEDDLGFGNSSRRSTQVERSNSSSSTQSTATVTKPTEPAKDSDKPAEVKPPASSGWLSRLWKRGETPGPVKANLGEQTSFYYDKDLKRWVNKNSSGEEEKPAALPPPPRAQTASPGTSTARLPTGPPLARTPPVRPATTTIDLTDSPPKQPPMRIRSNLVPPDAQSAPSTPAPPRTPLSMDAPLGDGPPPPGARARAAQAKRNVRNRYVDVFQQQ